MTKLECPNAELMTNSECCGVVRLERHDTGYEKVERVVLNALEKNAALPPDIRAFGDHSFIVFGAVTDAKQRPGFPADPLLIA